jgi:hypothetical protein
LINTRLPASGTGKLSSLTEKEWTVMVIKKERSFYFAPKTAQYSKHLSHPRSIRRT